MDDRFKKFISEIEISEEDIPRAERFVIAKGIGKHIIIKKCLESWSSEKKVPYTQIATAYRYDKRIRFVLFKYISYLEEFYRGAILDYSMESFNHIEWDKKIVDVLKSCNNDVNRALEEIDFRTLKRQCLKMPNKVKENLGLNNRPKLSNNLNSLVQLRNAVMHNKFLLLYKGLDVCYSNGNKSSTLTANICNLISFLPEEVGIKCANEINESALDRNESGDTKWEIASPLKVEIVLC